MNLFKEVMKSEVFPALGCTEPIAVAYAAGIAAQEIQGELKEINIVVDPGVYKNGLAITVPKTGGEKGNLIAGVLGALIKQPEKKILQSIALSHLINSYIKCFTGDLSPVCGCSIAAGVGAAAAIVYQQKGRDMQQITLAVNNLVSDLGGMLCDGAKGGCALKVVSSTDSAIRSAYMALNNHGITEKEGFVGKTAEETILHLSKISEIGMAKVDGTMLEIMLDKNLQKEGLLDRLVDIHHGDTFFVS